MQVFLEGFWGKLELHAWLIALGALGQVMGWSCLAGRRETSGRPVVDEQLDQSHAWPHPMGLGLPESLSDTQRQHQQWLVQAGQQGPCGFRFKPKIETKMLPKFLLGCWRASVTFVLCQVDW